MQPVTKTTAYEKVLMSNATRRYKGHFSFSAAKRLRGCNHR